MRAASSGEAGIICKAASTISIVNGNHSQVSAMTIAVSAQLVISEGTGRPMKAMKRWKGLMSTAYMTRQRMPTTMGGNTMGMRKPARAISRMRLEPLSNNANAEAHQQLADDGCHRQLHLDPNGARKAGIRGQIEIVARRGAEIPGRAGQRQVQRRERGQHQVDCGRNRN